MDMLFCSRGARSDGCGVVSQLEIGIGLDLGSLDEESLVDVSWVPR